jgi:RNA polymerase sigma-70 factor (ECF subfamily)
VLVDVRVAVLVAVGDNELVGVEALLSVDTLYREVLVLRFHEELSLQEIATVTRAPLSTVKSRLYRGLAAIKPKLETSIASHFEEIG